MRFQTLTGTLRWILPAALLAGPAPGARAQAATQAEVLQRWLDALGGRAAVESVQATYVWARIEGRDLRGRSEEWNTARGELLSIAGVPPATTAAAATWWTRTARCAS